MTVLSLLFIGLFTLVHFWKVLPYRRHVRLPVEHFDQLYSRFDSALHHVLWCASQEKFDTSVEHTLYPRCVVDPRLDRNRGPFHRTSFLIKATLYLR